jgi:hypothetical protein
LKAPFLPKFCPKPFSLCFILVSLASLNDFVEGSAV